MTVTNLDDWRAGRPIPNEPIDDDAPPHDDTDRPEQPHAGDHRDVRTSADLNEPVAGESEIRPDGPEDRNAELADWISPIDWAQFWADEHPTGEYIIDQIVPAGRQVSIFSKAKSGKSLLALDAVAALATGRPVLGGHGLPPIHVIYIDMEMTADDLQERLDDLGYGPDDDLSHLHYYQLVNLPPLDTDLGGQVLEAICIKHGARIVVIDTMARIVAGDENQADTYRNFYRHTGRRLKALVVALLRLDHGGKELERGQRGSSAKNDDLDVVFQLTTTDDQIVLKRTHSRIPWVPATVALRREVDPKLRHVLAPIALPIGTQECARLLDDLDVPLDASVRVSQQALKSIGKGRRTAVVTAAMKYRRSSS